MEEEEAIVLNNNNNDQELMMDLPPGFRFHPTDEEIITHYVKEKVMNTSFSAFAIGEVDLNKSEPWDLPKKAKMEEKEYYFFCRRDRKYPTGMRTNRATAAGYWKATGKDRGVYEGKGGGCLVGMKKTLVFYQGRAPKGEKTNWVMHEYRLEGKFSYYNLPKGAKDEWVVCRVFNKNMGGIKKIQIPGVQMNDHSFEDHYLFDNYASLPPLMDPYRSTTSIPIHGDGDDQNEFKPTAASTSSSRSHNYQNQLFFSYQNNNPNQGAISSSLETSHLHHLHHHHQKMDDSSSHCKAQEQFSSNQLSMISLSRDSTGLSTDMNTTTEISSVVSKQAVSKSYEDHFDATSIAELDRFWD